MNQDSKAFGNYIFYIDCRKLKERIGKIENYSYSLKSKYLINSGIFASSRRPDNFLSGPVDFFLPRLFLTIFLQRLFRLGGHL